MYKYVGRYVVNISLYVIKLKICIYFKIKIIRNIIILISTREGKITGRTNIHNTTVTSILKLQKCTIIVYRYAYTRL